MGNPMTKRLTSGMYYRNNDEEIDPELFPKEDRLTLKSIPDVDLARILANTMSGHISEWPQLKPLLQRMADKIEILVNSVKRRFFRF